MSIFHNITYPHPGQKTALVLGAGGFIGSHLVKRLKSEGFWVRGVDLKRPDFTPTEADEFIIGDLRDNSIVFRAFKCLDGNGFDEVYQLAADMGGAGYIFTGENDANVMHNSALINLNVVKWAEHFKAKRVFYSSSACMYPEHNQLDPDNPLCSEDSAYPANPDSEYGWEKLFSERLYLAWHRNCGVPVRIARFHNIFGPEGTWCGGKEKAPAAMCRKVAQATDGSHIEVWGDGKQTRSFLYIDDCINMVLKFTRGNWVGPVNIGSEEMISINDLAKMVVDISGKKIEIKNIPGPVGVRGRNSDQTRFTEKVEQYFPLSLKEGMSRTYEWINKQNTQKIPASTADLDTRDRNL